MRLTTTERLSQRQGQLRRMDFIVTFLILLTTLAVLVGSQQNHPYTCNNPPKLQKQRADLTLGGLFPVHVYKTEENQRTLVLNNYALTWTEAMLYAIDEINNDTTLIPKHELGFDIRDSCNDVSNALGAALDFILEADRNESQENSSSSQCKCVSRSSHVAVIGGAASPISTQLAHIFGIANIPQISYSSTSVFLSNKDIYRSFLRTIPSDTYQAKAIADLLLKFGWTYVSVVASDSEYGRAGMDALKVELKKRSICMAVESVFHPNLKKQELTRIITSLKAHTRAKVIVLWCQRPIAIGFLEQATKLGLSGKTWIGTETWGDSYLLYKLNPKTVGGMIGMVPRLTKHSGFEAHLAKLDPGNSRRNPWFAEFWNNEFNCEIINAEGGNTSLFNAKNNLQFVSSKEYYVYKSNTGDNATIVCPKDKDKGKPTASVLPRNKYTNVMDAVNAVVHAIESMLKCKEGEGMLLSEGKCPSTSPTIRTIDLLEYMKNVSFMGRSGTEVSFDKNGDLKFGSYAIKILQPEEANPSSMVFKEIGFWDGVNGSLEFKGETQYLWNGWEKEIPTSQCNDLCSPGKYSVNGSVTCCWTCVECPGGYAKESRGQGPCTRCPEGYESNVNRTRCVKMTEVYMDWSSGQALCVSMVSIFGGLLTLTILAIFVKHRETALVKASNRELSLIHLAVMFLIFTYPLVLIGKPNRIVCGVRPLYFAILFTISTSITLLKTDRLLRIFRAKNRISSRSHLLTNKMQIMTSVALTFIPVVTCSFWYLFRPPSVIVLNYSENSRIISCSTSDDTLLVIVLIYILGLALVCTYFAYRARTLPENFNEAKFIGFAMFSFCVFLSGLLPAFYSSTGSNRTFVNCLAVLGPAYGVLCIIYFPKVRIILFYPDQNKTEVFRINATTMNLRSRTNSPPANVLRPSPINSPLEDRRVVVSSIGSKEEAEINSARLSPYLDNRRMTAVTVGRGTTFT
ncbi:extracellular calcium-sensing receptor-like [Actinia tenebrosa]|uniref:Extracellular calcium-sensing receptor-like n=1 Tax=Actinia tenebrosa TaxID=6105 RepID=A0A6P8HJ84_ACTTE|nr:extracellular calcium-sensing receptor-like [Actinia tenebrosa]